MGRPRRETKITMREAGGNDAEMGVRNPPQVWVLWGESAPRLGQKIKSLQEVTMTNTFEKREKGFEAKWALDEESRFKVYARRNKLLGLWAAGELGLGSAAAETYAKEVIAADFEKPGEEDVFEKLRRDFDAKKPDMSDTVIRERMADLLEIARDQLKGELKK